MPLYKHYADTQFNGLERYIIVILHYTYILIFKH